MLFEAEIPQPISDIHSDVLADTQSMMVDMKQRVQKRLPPIGVETPSRLTVIMLKLVDASVTAVA
jgi:hypothetical protein